jgi:hypothetical protein
MAPQADLGDGLDLDLVSGLYPSVQTTCLGRGEDVQREWK